MFKREKIINGFVFPCWIWNLENKSVLFCDWITCYHKWTFETELLWCPLILKHYLVKAGEWIKNWFYPLYYVTILTSITCTFLSTKSNLQLRRFPITEMYYNTQYKLMISDLRIYYTIWYGMSKLTNTNFSNEHDMHIWRWMILLFLMFIWFFL